MPDQPDHSAIIGAVSRLDGKFESFRDEVMRRLGAQDSDLTVLKTAHSIAIGKSSLGRTIYLGLAGGFGAGIIKLVDWISQNGHHLTPPPGTGSH